MTIVVIQTVFDVLFRLCSDNADCVMCFNLIPCWCSFICRLTILLVSSMYTCPQEQGILYTPAELCGGLWSLGFLKICSIFLGLKFAYVCLISNLLFLWYMGEWIGFFLSDCVSETIVLFACLLIIYVFLSCPIFL